MLERRTPLAAASDDSIPVMANGGPVKVKLYAGLELRTPDRHALYELDPAEAPTVGSLAEAIGLGPGETGLVLVNGRHADLTDSIAAGDEVAVFPPLAGG